ncbi:MAG: glutaminyl-peptide cyclotransferase [Acidobacteriota bacterium]|nr:glutaminyl-peptide cyclotransferase [Acidobacteriota bacterium]
MRFLAAALTGTLLVAAIACSASGPSAAGETPDGATAEAAAAAAEVRLTLEVVATYPHDPAAFTQGLLWHRGKLYESTGMYGTSSLREVELTSGRIARRLELAPDQFAEGLALAGGELFQLSYQGEHGWVWDVGTFTKVREFAYRGEGWGLTFDGSALIQSDGSSRLTFRSPADFSVLRELAVVRAGRPQFYLNELEWVNGEIWANVWQSDEILRIDPRTGLVTGSVDASQLLSPEERRRTDVLNGIAWDSERRLFLLTGKYWPKLFAVAIRSPAPSVP